MALQSSAVIDSSLCAFEGRMLCFLRISKYKWNVPGTGQNNGAFCLLISRTRILVSSDVQSTENKLTVEFTSIDSRCNVGICSIVCPPSFKISNHRPPTRMYTYFKNMATAELTLRNCTTSCEMRN